MADRQRQTFKATFKGMNTREPADALPPGKVPLAVNIRADGEAKIRTRPGYVQTFNNGGGGAITDIGTYASLATDSKPRIIAHDRDGQVFIDDPNGPGGARSVGTVGTGGPGASIVPFRPSASPQSWAYIGNGSAYEKFSAPDDQNNVIQQKTGIAEPQPQPEAAVDGFLYTDFTPANNVSWTPYVNSPSTPPLVIPDPIGPYSYGGTASTPHTLIRLTDTVLAVFEDPASPPVAAFKQRYSVQVTGIDQTPLGPEQGNFGNPIPYSIGQTLFFNTTTGTPIEAVLEDIFPAVATGQPPEPGVIIENIYYYPGQIGTRQKCVIIPSQVPTGELAIMPNVAAGQPATAKMPNVASNIPLWVANLRRGSLIELGSGDICFVESVTIGPSGLVSIDTTTTVLPGTTGHQPGEAFQGVLALAVSFTQTDLPSPAAIVNQTVRGYQTNFLANTGLALVSWKLPTNPFNVRLGDLGVPQENDLLHITFSIVGSPAKLTQIKISFDVDDGTFLKNTLYFPASASIADQAATQSNQQSQFFVANTLSQNSPIYQQIYEQLRKKFFNPAEILASNASISINPSTGEVQIWMPNGRMITLNVPMSVGVDQYTELTFNLNSLQRTGNNQSRTLSDAVAVQIAVIATDNFVIAFGSVWVGGGGQPSTNVNASPYYYRIVPRSSLTGVTGNPSPAMRYGVTPRNQPIWVTLPSAGALPYDPQIDVWDIYRYGGTVASWRYLGTANATDPYFWDNYFDSAAAGGQELAFDNFEPWPTVDQPWRTFARPVTSKVVGTVMAILGDDAQFPASISRWLDGTLVTLNTTSVFTLWNRPTKIPGGWQFRFIQCAGDLVNPTIFIGEPIVAAQPLAYLWGPDANGFMFGCGDPFRPGTFQWSKANNPDATANNAFDLVPPSEPLLGGQVMDGISVVASSKRWWKLQPSQDPATPWIPVENPTGRGLAAPYAHTTDGKAIYFWAKDGIWVMTPDQVGQPLTNDIGNLFPQGESGITHGFDIVYAGHTIWAPEYKYAASFRLSVMNFVLRAHYRDCSGTPRTLVCDMTPGSDGQLVPRWSVDEYTDPMVASFQPFQPPSTLLAATERYQELYYADTNGGVWQETDLHNDGPWPIEALFATAEWDGGDSRVRKDWMDSMVDMLSPSGGTLQPVSNGKILGIAHDIQAVDQRTQILVPVGEEGPGEPSHVTMDVPSLGILFTWTDDFNKLNPNPGSCPLFEVVTTLYEWSLEFVPQPVQIMSWESIFTNCGLDGYWFIYRLRIAYQADGPVTLWIQAYDRNEPEKITLPATGGAYVKTEFVPTFNKFLLAKFHLTSDAPFALIQEDTEIVACQWGRTGLCTKCPGFGGNANP